MLKLFWVCVAFVLAIPVAFGQTFVVSSSSPSNNAVSVPLQAPVCFNFSAPARIEDPTVLWFPADSVTVNGFAWPPANNTVCQSVELRPNTRYVALVLEAESAAGDGLARPYAVNFTTGATNGNFNVSGTVTTAGGEPVDGTLVALVTGDLATGAINIAHVRVLSGQGASQAYTAGPVPLGLYTVAALRLPVGEAVPGFGLYDPDGDGTPNPVLLPFNVNVTLSAVAGQTAGDGFADIAAAAAGEDPAAQLLDIAAPRVEQDGTSSGWIYGFRTPAPENRTFSVTRLGPFVLPLQQSTDFGDGTALPTTFADTDVALSVAESAAGAAFRSAHATDEVTVAVQGTSDSATNPYPVPAWTIAYFASAAPGGPITDYLGVFVNFVTGQLLGSTSSADTPSSRGASVRVASANPFTNRLELAFDLVAAGPARLTVVDALGREVGVLAEGLFAPGESRATWRPGADVAPGTYWVRLQSMGSVRSIPVSLAR